MTLVVSYTDLGLYMGDGSIDPSRAELLITQAILLCESFVTPLPDAASVIVLSSAARAYANPQGVTSETIGPFNVQRPWAGVYLTKAERAALRRMAGSGGAFTVDPTPADVSAANAWAQIPLSPDEVFTTPPYYGDWDTPA